MKMRKEQFDGGSVMLETILVFPVYLMLIAVVFYVGEMSLYRNLLLELDECEVQRTGSRFADAAQPSDIIQFMFQMSNASDRKVSGFQYVGIERQNTELSTNQWWQKNRVWNKGSMTVPSWIKGIQTLNMRQSTVGGFEDSVSFYGSTRTTGGTLTDSDGLTFYSRRDAAQWRGGYNDPEQLCKGSEPVWVTIAKENYCADSSVASQVSGEQLLVYPRTGFDKTTGEGSSPYKVFSGE